MRIIHIFQQSTASSIPALIKDLNDFLPQQGVESSIMYQDDDGVFFHLKDDQKVTVCRRDKKSGFDFKLAFKLARYFKLKKIQAVHLHDVQLLPIVNLAASLAGIKSIYTQHGLLTKSLNKFWLTLNTAIIFNSLYVQQHFLKIYPVSMKKCNVIRDGFNIADYQQQQKNAKIDELKKKTGLTAEHFVLGNAGGLLVNQDQASLLKAFRKLAKKAANMMLVIVGDGPMRSDLDALVKEFGLEGRVKFISQPKNADYWMEVFQVFILSANVENYSSYILKAMASAKPVIATKIGSQAELLEEDCGFLVPCAFPERIESAVMRVYANQALLKKMGDRAREYLSEKLSMDYMTIEHANLYRSLIKQ